MSTAFSRWYRRHFDGFRINGSDDNSTGSESTVARIEPKLRHLATADDSRGHHQHLRCLLCSCRRRTTTELVVVIPARTGQSRAAEDSRSCVVLRPHVAADCSFSHARRVSWVAAPVTKVFGLLSWTKNAHIERLRLADPCRPYPMVLVLKSRVWMNDHGKLSAMLDHPWYHQAIIGHRDEDRPLSHWERATLRSQQKQVSH